MELGIIEFDNDKRYHIILSYFLCTESRASTLVFHILILLCLFLFQILILTSFFFIIF
ncbi:hypothetical protein HanXRQr2_Chr11g0498091 [Helianthus annuus]|uniref:Uncharacterized protein n=1 Tax=Helianthus annuus TaxID=4232 RepID=A0A9K3N0N2_HELAN|nr:hypothetical protein HanXRQr2_Chr11g0498091 [Helianthus annuus]KAJ0875736.1 hypothetical protein HanPSC8_Chr11g0480051 [Helianthus annuus]